MAKFSKHAFERTENRLSLSHKEVATILDSNKTVNIGVEESSRRVHRLFYSEPDAVPFVAVQDEKCGTIVTILPIDYHERCAWHVSYDAQKEAQSIITGIPYEKKEQTIFKKPKKKKKKKRNAAGFPIVQNTPSAYRLTATEYDEHGRRVRNFRLGSMPRERATDTPETLLKSNGFIKAFKERVEEICSDKCNDFNRLEVRISAGKHGAPIFLPYEEVIGYQSYADILEELKKG